MNANRVRALLRKEFLDLRRNRAVFVPVAILLVMCVALPFLLAIVLPAIGEQPLASDDDFRAVMPRVVAGSPELAGLSGDAAVQVFVFQQFLMFFAMVPVSGAMALAAYSVVGEKQSRTLEPLLATPLTTAELLLAKVLGSALPAFGISAPALLLYFGLIAAFAEPGVLATLMSARTALIVLALNPLCTLVALQAALMVSSRSNDPRNAQQIGVLVVLPIIGIFISQLSGQFLLTVPTMVLIASGLAVAWVILLMLSVALFDRETILTRWK
jgi:ABC-2 type transport system permease protein